MEHEAYRRAHEVRDEDDATKSKFPKVFENAVMLSNSEVNLVLEHRRKKKAAKGQEEDFKKLSPVLLCARDYCDRFDNLKNTAANDRVRFLLQHRGFGSKLTEFEVVSMMNLSPKTLKEVKAYFPSMQERFTDSELETMIDDVLSTVAYSKLFPNPKH